MKTMIFVDTNIFLDFYRFRNSDGGLSVLKHIDENHDHIITTFQIEVEYKKNRQTVIMDSLKAFKAPDWNSLTVPAFLSNAKPAQALASGRKWMDKQHGKARERIARVLRDPALTDPVYSTLQRLFRSGLPHHLGADSKDRRSIDRLALKRFLLGHPPRKGNDTSHGDSTNWEWIIMCAQRAACDIVIVSRDTDYGIIFEKEMILNDWLRQEFKDRVSRKRSITLTNLLTDALKRSKIKVTPEEEKGEEQLVSQATRSPVPGYSSQALLGSTGTPWSTDLQSLMAGQMRVPELAAIEAQLASLPIVSSYNQAMANLHGLQQYEAIAKSMKQFLDSMENSALADFVKTDPTREK